MTSEKSVLEKTPDSSAFSASYAKVWASIIITAFNSEKHIQACIESLGRQTFSNFEVLIVNNEPNAEYISRINLPDERFKVIESGANLGFAGGSNLGAKHATGEWIITLNPDSFCLPDWLNALHQASTRNPGFSMMSSTLIQSEHPELVDGFGDVMSIFGIAWRGAYGWKLADLPDSNRETFGPCGAAAAYRRELFEAVEGFDEVFFCYLEDVDIAFRMQNAGAKCLQVRNALVKHAGFGSSDGSTDFAVFQSHKNYLRLIIKNSPPALLPLMLIAHLSAFAYLSFRNRRHKEAKYRMAGFRAGLATIPAAFSARQQSRRKASKGSLYIARRVCWRPRALRMASPMFFSDSQTA